MHEGHERTGGVDILCPGSDCASEDDEAGWVVGPIWQSLDARYGCIAIILPVFSYAPKLYLWFVRDRMRKLYRRLRNVDNALLTGLIVPQVQALQTDLDSIDRAASIVPMRNSDLFFDLRTHIDCTRTHLASRLGAGRGQTARVA